MTLFLNDLAQLAQGGLLILDDYHTIEEPRGEPLARLLRQLVPTLQEPALRAYAQTILRAFARPAEADDPGLASSAGLLFEPLSAQEQRVLRLLATGHSNREIAQELVVSVNTVKDHAKHLYRKLGVSNRLQADEAARHLKLI